MVEGENNRNNTRTIAIVAGAIFVIIIFLLTYWLVTSLNKEEDQWIEFYLHNENAPADHIYFMEWENRTYSFEATNEHFNFDIERDRSYSFDLHFKDMATDITLNLSGTIMVTRKDGLVLDMTENDLGSYSIYTDMESGKVHALSVIFKDLEYEIYLSIQEYTV